MRGATGQADHWADFLKRQATPKMSDDNFPLFLRQPFEFGGNLPTVKSAVVVRFKPRYYRLGVTFDVFVEAFFLPVPTDRLVTDRRKEPGGKVLRLFTGTNQSEHGVLDDILCRCGVPLPRKEEQGTEQGFEQGNVHRQSIDVASSIIDADGEISSQNPTLSRWERVGLLCVGTIFPFNPSLGGEGTLIAAPH